MKPSRSLPRRAACGLAVCSLLASAAAQASTTSIGLGQYHLSGNHVLDTLNGMGLEASAVTYARDRGTLFFVGDEGMGVVEITRTGQTLSSMSFSAWPSRTSHNDAEALTYLGGGVLVVGEERLQDAFRFSYVAGGSVDLAAAPWASVANYPYNNVGLEGLSLDPRDGSFVAVKQDSPQVVFGGTLAFEADADGGPSAMTELFNGVSLFGLNSLSDVQTLSPVDALAGTPAADNLLLLSLDSRRLVEIDRSGNILSSLDISSFTSQAVEGLTVDELGRIYLVAEDSGTPASRLLVLSPVPEPAPMAMLLAGGLVLGWRLRQKA
jgi:uncharacterized protein YjiK